MARAKPRDNPFLRAVPATPRVGAEVPASPGNYPQVRLRRNRSDDWTRRLVAEARVSVDDLIWPLFVTAGTDLTEPVPSMPGVVRYSVDRILEAAGEAVALKIPMIEVFPNTPADLRDPTGSEALNAENLACRAIRTIKDKFPDLGVMCDVALDPYNSDGHDGLVRGDYVVNDETLEVLCKQAVVQAEAGCDVAAPSDMMDGRVAAIRRALRSEEHTSELQSH